MTAEELEMRREAQVADRMRLDECAALRAELAQAREANAMLARENGVLKVKLEQRAAYARSLENPWMF